MGEIIASLDGYFRWLGHNFDYKRAEVSSARHLYEVRPRKDHRGFDLISDALPFGQLWYGGPEAISNAIGYAEHYSRSHHAVIRVYNDVGNVIETHEHAGEFKEP